MGRPIQVDLKQKVVTLARTKVKSVSGDLTYIPPILELKNSAEEEPSRGHDSNSKNADDRMIKLEILMNSFESGQSVLFIGPAGSGKTTLLHQIVQKVIDGAYENLRNIELVIFIEHRVQNLSRTVGISGRDLLFQHIRSHIAHKNAERIIRYAEDYPTKILFVLDSLDSLEFCLEQYDDSVKYESTGSPAKHCGNFLAGKYLTGCRILTSSREYSVRHLDPKIRPKTVVALTGLAKNSIKQIILHRFEDTKARNIWHCFTDSPALIPLCSSPACLLYTLSILDCSEDHRNVTFTKVLMEVVEKLYRALLTMRANADAKAILKGLENLSFDGLEIQRTAFSETNLEDARLSSNMLDNLSIPTPWSGKITFLRKDKDYLFTHKCLQEFFTALRIARMPLSKFIVFINEYINQQQYTMVRRFLYGILFSRKTTIPFLTVSKETEKHQVLLGNIASLLRKRDKKSFSADCLEIFYCLHESGEATREVVSSSLNSIELGNLALSSSDALAISTAIELSTKLEHLTFSNCSITTEILQTIENCLKGKHVQFQISTLNIISNGEITSEGMEAIGQLANHCKLKSVTLHNCAVSAPQLRALNNTLREIENIVLFEDRTATSDDVLAATELFPKVLTYFGLDLWKISDRDRKTIQSCLNQLHPTALHINLLPNGLLQSRDKSTVVRKGPKTRQASPSESQEQVSEKNRVHREVQKRIEMFKSNAGEDHFKLAHIPLDMENAKFLGNVLGAKKKVSLLRLRACLQEKSLSELSQSLEKSQFKMSETLQIQEVDVSCHQHWQNDDAEALMKVLKFCRTSVLDISNMGQAEETNEEYKHGEIRNKLKVLKSSHTSKLEKNKIKLLARIASCGKIEELHMAECDLRPDTLNEIRKTFPFLHLKVLDLSYNCKMSKDGYKVIGEIAQKIDNLHLILRDCDISAEDLKSLSSGLKGNKLSALDLAFNTELEKTVIAELVKLVIGCRIQKLSLAGCELDLEKLKCFQKSMRRVEIRFQLLDLSDNPTIREDCVHVLLSIINNCEIEKLRLRNCGTTEDKILQLASEKKITDRVQYLQKETEFLPKSRLFSEKNTDTVEETKLSGPTYRITRNSSFQKDPETQALLHSY